MSEVTLYREAGARQEHLERAARPRQPRLAPSGLVIYALGYRVTSLVRNSAPLGRAAPRTWSSIWGLSHAQGVQRLGVVIFFESSWVGGWRPAFSSVQVLGLSVWGSIPRARRASHLQILLFTLWGTQGYLAHRKEPPPRTSRASHLVIHLGHDFECAEVGVERLGVWFPCAPASPRTCTACHSRSRVLRCSL